MKLTIKNKLIEHSEEQSKIRRAFSADKKYKEYLLLRQLLDYENITNITKKEIMFNLGIKSYSTFNRLIKNLENIGHIIVNKNTYLVYETIR